MAGSRKKYQPVKSDEVVHRMSYAAETENDKKQHSSMWRLLRLGTYSSSDTNGHKANLSILIHSQSQPNRSGSHYF